MRSYNKQLKNSEPPDVGFAIEPQNNVIFYSNIFGFPLFQTVTAVPTTVPANAFSQIVIVNSPPGTYQLYIYESVSGAWKAVALT